MTSAASRVALSALLFSNGRLAWLRHAWQRGQLRPLVCKAFSQRDSEFSPLRFVGLGMTQSFFYG